MDVIYIYVYTRLLSFLKIKPDKNCNFPEACCVTIHSERRDETNVCVRLLKPAQRGEMVYKIRICTFSKSKRI